MSGCTTERDVNVFSGIEKEDIDGMPSGNSLDLMQVYKGYSDHWAAVYYLYRLKGEENRVDRLFMKYIGEDPLPTGQISYSYKTEASSGSGELPATEDSRVYNLGQSGGNGSVPSKDAIVSFQVNWNGESEVFDLKPSR